MRVYAEKTQEWFGRIFTRLVDARKTYLPDGVELVANPKDADLQIIDLVGPGEQPLLKAPKYVAFIHCWLTCDKYSKEFLENAEVVFSTYDIPSYDQTIKYKKFVRLPMGYDPDKFFPLPCVQKKYGILTTGYVADTESIDSCYLASRLLGTDMVHIGKNFGWGQNFVHKEHISDTEMQIQLNRSRFVSGLRAIEGFEAIALEGLACGVRPVMFDIPIYTYWMLDHARYVAHGLSMEQTGLEIAEAIKFPSRVTEDELGWLKDNFTWEIVTKRFWKEVLE